MMMMMWFIQSLYKVTCIYVSLCVYAENYDLTLTFAHRCVFNHTCRSTCTYTHTHNTLVPQVPCSSWTVWTQVHSSEHCVICTQSVEVFCFLIILLTFALCCCWCVCVCYLKQDYRFWKVHSLPLCVFPACLLLDLHLVQITVLCGHFPPLLLLIKPSPHYLQGR